MNAFEMIRHLIDVGINLEQAGHVQFYEDDRHERFTHYFGVAQVLSGQFAPGMYVYFYDDDDTSLKAFIRSHQPDITVMDDEGSIIYIFKVE